MIKVLLLAIYQFNDDSSESSFLMLNTIVYQMTDECTSSDNKWYNKWQEMTTSGTMNDNELYKEGQRVVKRVTTSDNEWQRVTVNDNEWYNERQRVVQRMKANESDFRFQNETIMQCKTTIYSALSFWKYSVKQNIWWSSHRRYFIKNFGLISFAIFTGKNLKACSFIKKRLQNKCFPVNIANFLKTPILKIICERLLLHLFLIKTRDAFAAAKIFIK